MADGATPTAPQPPSGRGGGLSQGQVPFGAYEQQPALSPEEANALQVKIDDGVGERLRKAQSIAPSVRQQTRAELINLTLLYERLGNPFSVRRIPFSVLRDMSTDPMIAFANFYTRVPLVRADWFIEGPDAQLNAAVDAALRPINSELQVSLCNKLLYGFQPMCKRFKMGALKAFYRDPNGDDPEKDLPVWESDLPALLWDAPYTLAPEHCMPRWNERGGFDGFYYSIVPLPNPIQIGIANLYGYSVVPGYEVTSEFAMWPVNEKTEHFGDIYGLPRANRVYRYFWSYWYRWALADRAFENLADPVKRIYFPTDVDHAIDTDDPGLATGQPTVESMRALALSIGDQMRAGSVLALPGDFVVDDSGKMTAFRKWDAGYIEPKSNFREFAESFSYLDNLKFRGWFVPEQAFVSGQMGATGGTGSGSSSRLMGVQLGEVYQQSQQLLANENDDVINTDMIPQWIAANFPEKAGTPCRKVTRGFGAYDSELIKQIIQLVGQVKGMTLPVDIREMLRQAGMPLLTEKQIKQQSEQIAKEAAAMQPTPFEPTKVGMQGYNAGVEKTPQGYAVYVQPPERIDLSTSNQGFLSELPDVPAYGDAAVRASMMKLRKLMLGRYESKISSFVEHLSSQPSLHLAQQSQDAQQVQEAPPPPAGASTPAQPQQGKGLSAPQAAGIAAAIVGGWATAQVVDDAQQVISALLFGIAQRAAKRELKLANLGDDVVDYSLMQVWAQRRASFVEQSIDSTIAAEMTTYLTAELQKETDPTKVAKDAEDRFSDTAQTHAERVVMAEVLPAYNFGMLSAARDVGVTQAQAHDASGGRDNLTDPECRRRDGDVMSVETAIKESADEHPHGTLWFSLLSTENFRLERIEKLPSHLNGKPGMMAAYDDELEVLYISQQADGEQEREFALAVGSLLALR